MTIDELAQAAIASDALRLRQFTQDWLREHPCITDSPAPASQDPTTRIIAAALVELFAQRSGQASPTWTESIGSLREPLFLLKSASTMPRLRQLCQAESPQPLRRRNLFAPANFLEFA